MNYGGPSVVLDKTDGINAKTFSSVAAIIPVYSSCKLFFKNVLVADFATSTYNFFI